jgi:hypothetical protein
MAKWSRVLNDVVQEVVDYDPVERGVNEAFLPTFHLCSDDVEIGWLYDPETQTFSAPPEPEPIPEPPAE